MDAEGAKVKMHYLDNAATTPVAAAVADRIHEVMVSEFGNPSSLYSLGVSSEKVLNSARRTVADAVGVLPEEIYFTAGGSESNNIAILGTARARSNWGDTVIAAGYEHPSVQNTVRHLADEGFRIIEVRPVGGIIRPEDILEHVDKKTVLVCAMRVNNETGAMIDTSALASEVKKINRRTGFHCDTVQSFLKEKTVFDGSIDTASISGHKIHAPKGIGALYIRKGYHLAVTEFGGGQEKGIRPGTENVPYAAGLAAAITAAGDFRMRHEKVRALRDLALEKILAFPNAVINSPEGASPYILNFSFLGYRSETMIHFLESRGIYVSGGSACSKGQKSHTLEAMGLPDKRIDAALRVSFSADNTPEDVQALAEGLAEAAETLMKAN